MRWSPSHASPSPISTSARCASGARSPEAPTEPCERHHRRDVGLEQFAQRLDERGPAAREPARERGRAQQQHGAHDVARRGRAHAGRVRAQQIHLQLAHLLLRDAAILEFAESGGHAVDHALLAHRALDHGVAARDALSRRRRPRAAGRRSCRPARAPVAPAIRALSAAFPSSITPSPPPPAVRPENVCASAARARRIFPARRRHRQRFEERLPIRRAREPRIAHHHHAAIVGAPDQAADSLPKAQHRLGHRVVTERIEALLAQPLGTRLDDAGRPEPRTAASRRPRSPALHPESRHLPTGSGRQARWRHARSRKRSLTRPAGPSHSCASSSARRRAAPRSSSRARRSRSCAVNSTS